MRQMGHSSRFWLEWERPNFPLTDTHLKSQTTAPKGITMRHSPRCILVLWVALLTGALPHALAQNLRMVHDNTIISPELPKAELTFAPSFHYVGGQQVNLYGMADAEQHLFVAGGKNGVIDAFYWVQFEHRVPSDHHTYDYQLGHTTDIGGLSFVYDVKSWPDYATMQAEDPKSDGAAITRLLAKSNLKFPARAARVRMFHLPTADHRTELMIIYGEALPEDSAVPVRKDGVDIMQESPAFAQKLLADLKSQLTIHPN
jgi:hypothetical protein